MRRICSALLLTAMCMAGPARAGQVATFSQTGGQGNCTIVQRFEAPYMRTEYSCAGEQGVRAFGAFDASKSTGWLATEHDHAYFELNPTTLKQAADAMEAAKGMMARLSKMMAALPPDQRKAAQAMMEKQGGGVDFQAMTEKPVATRTPEVKTINGVNCTVWNMVRGGKVSEKNCIVARGQNGKVDDVYKGFAPYKDAMRHMLGDIPLVPSAIVDSDEWFVAEVSQQTAKGPRQLMALQKLEEGKLDAALLTVPAGYTKKAMPTMPSMGKAAAK